MLKTERQIASNSLDLIVASILRNYRLASLSQAAKLIYLADQAITTRQTKDLIKLSDTLLALPLPDEFEFIQKYYHAIAIHDFGRGDSEKALSLHLEVAERAPLRYRARGLDAAGAIYLRRSRIDEAYRLYSEATGVNNNPFNDPLAYMLRTINISTIIAEQGDSKGSLCFLQKSKSSIDFAESIYPVEYANFLNSLSVGLSECGYYKEAQYYIRAALASPYAHAYPEWPDTWEEIARRGCRASRSVVGIFQEPYPRKILKFWQGGDTEGVAPPAESEQAAVHKLSDWKASASKPMTGGKANKPLRRITKDDLQEMNTAEKVTEIMRRLLDRSNRTDDSDLDEILLRYAEEEEPSEGLE